MSMRVSELAAKFYAFMEGRRARRTVDYYRSFISRFVAAVEDVQVGELRKHHLLLWGRSWHQLQAVQRLFEWAHAEAELIDRNPFKGIKLPRPGQRKRILDRTTLAKILRLSRPHFRCFLLAMRETIARPQEIRQVKWEWIRWDGTHSDCFAALHACAAYFELAEYKSRTQRSDPGEPRRILINRRLSRLLLRLGRGLVELRGPIFLNKQGRAWTSNAVRLRMRRLRRRAGLDPDERGELVVAYTLRHTQATDASARGVSDRVLAELMGHTSTRTTARYCHLSKKHLRDAMQGVWNHPPHGGRQPD